MNVPLPGTSAEAVGCTHARGPEYLKMVIDWVKKGKTIAEAISAVVAAGGHLA